jgi:TIR domain
VSDRPAAAAQEPTGAVFLSYASEDAAAAERIATALRSAGLEVWFDRTELRGGDIWERQIEDRIHDCRLFIPLISANTEHRDEGYFRREWSLAVDRTRDMADKKPTAPVILASDMALSSGSTAPNYSRENRDRSGSKPSCSERLRLVPGSWLLARRARPAQAADGDAAVSTQCSIRPR